MPTINDRSCSGVLEEKKCNAVYEGTRTHYFRKRETDTLKKNKAQFNRYFYSHYLYVCAQKGRVFTGHLQ